MDLTRLPTAAGPYRKDKLSAYMDAVVRLHDLCQEGRHAGLAAVQALRDVRAALRDLTPGEKVLVGIWQRKRFGI